MKFIMEPSFLINYRNGYLINKDLELVSKEKVVNSSILQKLVHWIRGTYSAKETAVSIDKYMTNFFAKGGKLYPETKILVNLEELNKKFSKKGINTLEETIKKVKTALEKEKLENQNRITPDIKTSIAPKKAGVNANEITNKKTIRPVPTLPKEKAKTEVSPLPAVQKPPLASEATTSSKKRSTKSTSLVRQLKAVQDQINNLDIHSPNFKKNAGEIRRSLQSLAASNPKIKEKLLPLIEIMNILEIKGVFAFKPSFLQQSLLEKFNPSYSYDKDSLTIPLTQFLEFLKTSTQTSSPTSLAKQMLSKSSQIKEKWSQLEVTYFEHQLKLDKNPQLKANAMVIKQLMTDVRERLSKDYQLILDKVKENYSSEKFQELISHYPNDDIELNKESILEELMDSLADQIIRHVNLSSKITLNDWKPIKDILYQAKRKNLALFLKNYLERYDWFHDNLTTIKVPYDQGVDHHRNQGRGTCYQNSLRRHRELSTTPNTSTERIEMGSEKKDRMIQAKAHLGESTSFKQDLANYGIDNTNVKFKSYKLETKGPEDYSKLVKALIQPPKKGSPLLGIWTMTYTSPEGRSTGHAFNVQVDTKLNKFRILDDNTGAMEFSSVQELKDNFIPYLRIFYSEYSEFEMINIS